MFNGAKPTFGAAAASTPFGFGAANTTASSPFGAQSAFGKPATQGFGSAPAFGQTAPSAFGQPVVQQSAQQPGSLFGAAAAQTSAFGAVAPQTGAFGGFGQQQQPQMFGASAAQPAQNTSLFGQPSNTFGSAAKAPGFGGFGTAQPQQQTALFSQTQTSAAAPVSAFGGFGATAAAQPTTAGMFGSAAVGGASAFGGAQATGTAVAKYQETIGTDTLMKNGQSNNVSTKQHCITAMKEYEAKSFEELRMEDYMANRKGPQPGAALGAPGGMFGAQAPAAGNQSLFGASLNQTQSIFGQPQQQQPTNTLGAFGQPAQQQQLGFGQQATAFGQPTTAGQPAAGGLFGGAAASSGGLFMAKPFGQSAAPASGGLFGQPAVSAAPAFGAPQATATTAFGSAFGQPAAGQQQQTAPLFGAAAPTTGGLFGQTSAAQPTGFGGFGATTATSTAGGGLFGQKPAQSAFGTLGTGTFGAPATSASTGFGSFGQPAQATGGLFGNSFNKPAAPTFGGFGTAQTQPAAGTGLSLFGNNAAAAKPGGLFGGGASAPATGGGLFGGGGSAFGQPNNALGGGLGTGSFGQSLAVGGQPFGALGAAGQPQPPAGVPIHQQILSMASSPYGDNPIFKGLKPSAGLSEDALKPTNPAAQKALLEAASAQQYKVSPRVGQPGGLKVKPVGSSFSKKSLFGGLEEFDSSVEESFSLKPNAKRLIIKARSAATTPNAGPSTAPAALDSGHRRLTVGRTATPQRSDSDADGSFRGQIPATAPVAEGGRRESWLHSNALEKNRQPLDGNAAGGSLDNTIQELVSGGGKTAEERRLAVLQERNDERQRTAEEPQRGLAGKSAFGAHTSSDSLGASRSFLDDSLAGVGNAGDLSMGAAAAGEQPAHPTGVVLQRAGYYTIPSLEALVEYLAEDGSCRVPNFTIGRRGYGSVYFDAEIDVAGLNLDELVHFRHKEVIIYPDDENKPPIGCELNRKAEVTLDQVWPQDKTLKEPIKDRERLEAMDYQGKLRRVCDKHDMRFVDYRPETGSWVFRVEHFSKYGLNDSDDEDEDMLPIDPKKAKMAMTAGGANSAAASGSKQVNGSVPKAASQTRQLDRDSLPNGRPANSGLGGFDAGETFTNLSNVSFQPLSPSSAIAMDIGADSHKLQLMKASFFVDDDFDGKSVMSEQLDGRDSPEHVVPSAFRARPQPASAFGPQQPSNTGSQSIVSGSTASGLVSAFLPHVAQPATKTVQPSAAAAAPVKPLGPRSAPLHVRPKIALVRVPRTVIPFRQSLLARLADRQSAVDMAFQMGRHFRIGWAAPCVMLSLNTQAVAQRLPGAILPMDSPALLADLYAGRRPADRSHPVLVVSRIASAAPIDAFGASVEPHLQLQLRHSVCSDRDQLHPDQCPRWRTEPSAPGTSSSLFAQHQVIARTSARLGDGSEYVCTVWSLCDALWGADDELDDVAGGSHLAVMRRRELLSDWLESVVADEQQARQSKASYLEHLLDLLCTHRVAEACDLCFSNGDINLAFLLGQASGGPAVRQLVQHQMCAWQDVQADAFIAPERLKAYMLVAGVSLISSAHGAINVFAELDWLRAFALNVWYLSSATASVPDALAAYERSYRSEEFYAQPPTPPYAGAYRAQPSNGTPVEDVRFHLLKLFARRSHPLEGLLNPATHTSDPMDFRLSWLLLQTLESIGYRHCGQLSAAQIHTSFAAQLERAGLWHWACFVLMHLPDGGQRALSVQQLLYKYVRLSEPDATQSGQLGETPSEYDGLAFDERERFVVDELHVPLRWLHWAKAVRAGALGRHHVQAQYLLQAEQWSQAHDVIMLHIVPDVIINDNVPYLQHLLQRFGDRSRHIPNWANQGGLLLEYIRLGERFDRLRSAPDTHIDAAWQQLQQPLSELCSRINLFPCPTAKHRLCQSEIAQRLANLVSGMRMAGSTSDGDYSTCSLMRVILEKLPLPQEYAMQKLRALLEDGRLIDELQLQSERC